MALAHIRDNREAIDRIVEVSPGCMRPSSARPHSRGCLTARGACGTRWVCSVPFTPLGRRRCYMSLSSRLAGDVVPLHLGVLTFSLLLLDAFSSQVLMEKETITGEEFRSMLAEYTTIPAENVAAADAQKRPAMAAAFTTIDVEAH